MRNATKAFAVATIAATLAGVPAAYAGSESRDNVYADFIEKCDTDKDGMVSKAEMMKMVEKVWAKTDTRKTGKIDKKQVEFFLQELMKSGA